MQQGRSPVKRVLIFTIGQTKKTVDIWNPNWRNSLANSIRRGCQFCWTKNNDSDLRQSYFCNFSTHRCFPCSLPCRTPSACREARPVYWGPETNNNNYFNQGWESRGKKGRGEDLLLPEHWSSQSMQVFCLVLYWRAPFLPSFLTCHVPRWQKCLSHCALNRTF